MMIGSQINKIALSMFLFSVVQYYLVVTNNIFILLCVYGVVVLFSCLFLLSNFFLKGTIIENFPLIMFYLGTVIISLPTFRPGGKLFNGSDMFYLLSAISLSTVLILKGENITFLLCNKNPLFFPLFLFLSGALLSLKNTNNIQSSIMVIIQYLFLFGIWIPLSVYIHDSYAKIKISFICLIVASLFPITISISDYFLHTNLTSFANNLLNLNLETTVPIWGRFGTIMNHPNNFGILLIVVFPLSLWIVTGKKKFILKCIGIIYMCGIFICCATTGSRTVILSILSQILMYFILGRFQSNFSVKLVKTMITGTFLITFFSYSSQFIINDPLTRFFDSMNKDIGKYGADIGRIESIKDSFKNIKTYPLTGVGVDAAGSNLDNVFVHNTILRLWSSIGILGLFAITFFYLKPIKTALNLRKFFTQKSDRQGDELLAVSLTMTIGWYISDMVQPQFHNRIKWISVILIFAILKVATDFSKKDVGLDQYRVS